MRSRVLTRVVVALVAVGLLASACGDDNGDDAATTTQAPGSSVASSASTTLAPQRGGSVTIGQLVAGAGMDPILLAGGGTTGANELAAIYDTIVRYNPKTGGYEPRTGTMTSNADFSEWTLKIKPNIKFTDGTPYDAAAVKFNLDRITGPNSRSPSLGVLRTFLDTATVVDPLTVVFKLKQGWAGFQYPFAREVGMIASPTAIQKAGANFNVTPGDAGAGPFKIGTYKPGEELVLKRNESYWNGDVYLDEIKFVLIGRGDPTAVYTALQTNTIQAGLFRDPISIADAISKGFVADPASFQPGGNMAVFNSGIEVTCAAGAPAVHCAGKSDGTVVKTKTPTSDVRVRKAIQLAVDPEQLNQRVYSGKATVGTELFTKDYPWYPNVPGPKYDQAEARRLVTEAKQAGWDGKLRLLTASDPASTGWGQVVSTSMQAVGIEVTYKSDGDIASLVNQVLTLKDFDVVLFGMGLLDEADNNYAQFLISVVQPRYGYSHPDMTAAVDLLRQADTNDKKIAASKRIAEVFNRDVPAAVWSQLPQVFLRSSKLQGTERSANFITLMDKMWLQK